MRSRFHKLLLTNTLLEKIGFTEWNDGSGDFTESRLFLSGKPFDIYDIEEKDDENDGYYNEPIYVSAHFTNDKFEPIYFLHDLYEYIKSKDDKEALKDFVNRCEQTNCNYYIKSYLDYLNS